MTGMDESAHIPVSTPLSAWLDKLAQPAGAPGGGAAAGVMLALSAALLRMVAEYTPGDDRAEACASRLVQQRSDALGAAEGDGIRSAELGSALAEDADDPARDAHVRDAALAAARSSVVLGEVGVGLVDELRLLDEIGNPHLDADLVVAAEALAAGIAGASVNLRANRQLAARHGAEGRALSALDADARGLARAREAASALADANSRRFDES